ncbi:uncharacterized protein LOC131355569 [Hemibagrus wyckioides]|uniref:uncharacterized protein LOC131355569 n=1 Tax=Hemibagrus wyckioides TaxID=337641 RepID=UPI00266D616E|nr:uncharacterized protein LOC131355569 [Hemibagrus wyckioides]
MVQVILNHDRLAMAYRGHSIEVMRELREEHEVNRIKDMEKEKLAEIEMKEELFSTFCQFLSDFDRHYSTREKTDLFEVKVKDVPCYFESFHSKMDYHPALNALKESWGIWLILHTDQINVHNDLTELKENLIQHLQDKSRKLLQGHSENLYDHIQQALGRTALHLQNKTRCDYGAKTYWKKVSESDNYFRAVALYNQAYITINMAREGYKSEACSLLKEAEKAIDVYVSETTRTLSFCSLSVTPDFEPHHSGSCNFQTQMQARMNIFNSWKENITKILDLLGSGNGDFRTEELTLYSLSTEEDFVSSSELGLFRNYGLAVVFEVKQKPKFSFDALICCFLGVIQVVAGVLICGLSAGSMSSFGLGLISEGVSDMIYGVMGMINGTFDWASWAISKAISIGISLACGGFRVLKRSFSSVKNAASNILNGTKSLKSVASSALRSGKNLFVSTCKSAKSLVFSISVENITKTTGKLNLKYACKYAFQELAVQGVNTAVNKYINSKGQKTFQQGFRHTFKESVHSTLQQNKEFVRTLTDFISSGIPKTALQKKSGSYKISKTLEKKMMDHMIFNTNFVMNDLMVDCKQIHQVINTLSQVWDKSAEFVAHRSHACIRMLMTTASMSTTIYEMYKSIPTKQTIDSNFVPAFLKSLGEEPLFETYDNDGRDKLEDVERLKDELIDVISEIISQTMVDSFSGSASSMFTKTFTQRLNSVTGKVVGNLLGRHKTQSFFDSQQHHYDLKSATECKERSLTEGELNELKSYADKITDEQNPATGVDVRVLTEVDVLDGKGICLTVVDDKGNFLTEETYPGTDPAAGTIKLVLTKTPQTSSGKGGLWSKLKDQVMAKDTPQSGHIDSIRPDGSQEIVNCLFHAVVQATTNDPNVDLKQKAVELRHKVSEKIRTNPYKYAEAVKIQNKFDKNTSNQFKIEDAIKKSDKEKFIEYKKKNKNDEDKISKEYTLGEAGRYRDLIKKKKPTPGVVDADHIPPKKSLQDLCDELKSNKEMVESFETKNEALFNLVKNTNDNMMFAMNVLRCDHQRAATTGSSHVSRACRKLLTKTFIEGDVVKGLKLSFIMAHPETSDHIFIILDRTRKYSNIDYGLTAESTRKYYEKGFLKLINEYEKINVLNKDEAEELRNWVKNKGYLLENAEKFINEIIEFYYNWLNTRT